VLGLKIWVLFSPLFNLFCT